MSVTKYYKSSVKKIFSIFLILPFFQQVIAQKNEAARYEIDTKRRGIELTDDAALLRGKEFERLDSTYYVGYLLEGYYKYNHSADYLGYKNAIPTLLKAKELMEKDFNPMLKNMFSNLDYLTQNYNRFQDYYSICNALKECYDNIEMPDSVMSLLNHIATYHFKKDFFGIYYHRAWTYHRNRIFTSAKYSFLKNSVGANERMAFKYCYEGLAFIKENEKENDEWFGQNQALADDLQIYHYLALLHCYNKNYDSSFYYYNILAQYGLISWNNYAGFQTEIGNFSNAQTFFKRDLSISYSGENVLKEPYYYLPELYIYAGRTEDAISLSNRIIQQNGSRPGFGWYNIALSRSYMYNDQLDSAENALDKAADFKELHIGTTLTQEQYEFTINLLRVNLLDRRIEELKFLHSNWWYSPTTLFKMAKLKWQKLMAEYNTCIELAYNPDRSRMVYDLFCSESTTTFDEAWYLMKDFNPKFFAKKYHNYQTTDKRENIQRYFKLFEAKFNYEDGRYKIAEQELENILSNTKLDSENEKLFLGRLYEAASRVYKISRNQYSRSFYNNLLLETYPQLIPFSNIRIPMRLETSGVDDETTEEIKRQLSHVNIDWTDKEKTPLVSIYFERRGDKYQATINVKSNTNIQVVSNRKLVFSSANNNVGNEIALRIFGKGGNVVFEEGSEY
ncbi:tetratricopeptide repeat protein [Arachidicoccus soli]|uniref:Tetratricopeptide repeat protein n=1 Tax=Arachidicoccus soli TaxID=2341117 RepID=A0A386HU09_9BACT|nr:hypothetical protein [Arachidicoccus soli]AYD48910.1 hypothetical protein D6B99_15610 [Arachidicoccus soli]